MSETLRRVVASITFATVRVRNELERMQLQNWVELKKAELDLSKFDWMLLCGTRRESFLN